jgi:hypothetical protein
MTTPARLRWRMFLPYWPPGMGWVAMAPPSRQELARQRLNLARDGRQHLTRLGDQATERDWEWARINEWSAYCQARRAGLKDPEIARLLAITDQVLWERHARHYPPPP